ncbi:MAG: FKBP-type peptidyl-prolyl cis-trans isomerase [Tannerella sp.]|jgi:FKBP-type peptidyl-prolyl cis-trans isomerase|nr:FKBP-type peptidyl-prolyl cis-trans isomerase [Tannerella sp.]
MKKINVLIMLLVAVMAISCCPTKKVAVTPSTLLNSALDTACYSIGVSYGAGLRDNLKEFPGGEANLNALAEGFIKAIKSDSTALMTQESAQAFIQSYMAGIQQKEMEAEKTKGEEFMAANKSKAGVITTESGLQYKIIQQGTGAIPNQTDNVKVHYTGKLLDGTVFDSSVQRGEPVVFGVNQVIVGWTELLLLMPVGSKYIVWIPSALAYGDRGAGQTVKPYSTLEFEVELLDIEKEAPTTGE